MEERFTRRLFLPDIRGGNRYLRVTWHKETSAVVFSHWQDDICVTTTQISLRDATQLISLVVAALKESAFGGAEVASTSSPARPKRLLDRLRGRFSPQLAQVIGLHDRIRRERADGASKGA